MMERRFLNGLILTEVEVANLTGSSPTVEKYMEGNNSFTKKIGGRGYCSAYSVKYAMKQYLKAVGYEINDEDGDPYHNINLDLFGHMNAMKKDITVEEYEQLSSEAKQLYQKKKKEKNYELKNKSVTKRMDGKFKLNGLVGLGLNYVQKEFVTKTINGITENMITREIYSDVMQGIFNFEIDRVGKFIVGDEGREKMDFISSDLELKGVKEELDREERIKRIQDCLYSINFLTLESNQSNALNDTKPNFVILGEFGWGNNMFQGLITREGLDVETLKNRLIDYDRFRKSKIWIGIDGKLDKFNGFKIDAKEIKEQLKDYDVEVLTVGQAFNEYNKYIEDTLE